jgi:putative SOS response-associated peptidase YedK
MITITGIGDHDRLEWLITMNGIRNEVISATIIVRGTGPWIEPDHERKPVMLDPKDFDGWLDGSLGLEALTGASAVALRAWPVSKRLNRTGAGDDDPTLVEPL